MITDTIQFAIDNCSASDKMIENYCYYEQFKRPDFSWEQFDTAERIEHILCYPYVFGGEIQWGRERTQAAEELAIHYPEYSEQYDENLITLACLSQLQYWSHHSLS